MPKRKAEEEQQEPELGNSEEEDDSGASGSDSGSQGSGSDSEGPSVSDDEEESEDDEDGEGFKEVQVDFQFLDPSEIDFHGLRALLHNYLDGADFDSSGLVDAIIKQSSVGTVVKAGEDKDDPVAVMTALNTQQHRGAKFMQQIRAFLEQKCPELKESIGAWDTPGTGLLINERMINVPPQIAPPLVQTLFDDIECAAEDEEAPAAERDAFKFERFILLTRVFTDPEAQAAGAAGPSSSAAGGKKARKGAAAEPVLVYVRPDDEFFHKQANASATFKVERPVGKDELQPLRLALVIAANKVPAARRELDQVVGNAMASS